MAEQLESLLNKIQEEAVSKADEKSKQKISDAEKSAAEIIANAEKKADGILASAEQKAEQFKVNGQKSLEHAARDMLIYLRRSINSYFEAIIKNTVSEIIPVEVVQEILIKLAVEAQKKGDNPDGVRIFLSEKDYKNLTDFYMHRFHDTVKQGAEIHPMKSIKSGFRICLSGKNVEYDYSDEIIIDMLSKLISPAIEEILRNAAVEPLEDKK